MSRIIVLNPSVALQLEYEEKWKDLVSFDSFLSIKAQREVFESNEKGYEAYQQVKYLISH